jgi:hypothetical protein
MKFKPILGSDLSGHVGGVVASHNTYGPYFRQRVKPVNKKTTAQQAQRSSIAAVAQTWRSLDPTVQAAWLAASIVKTSKKGDKVTLTGAAAFQFVNTLRVRLGLGLVTNPPTSTIVPTLTPPSISMTGAYTLSIAWPGDTWDLIGGGVIMSAALLTSAGRSFSTPSLAVGGFPGPVASPQTVNLPFSVPIGGRARVLLHATAPDGRQTTYVSVDVANPSFAPPTPGLVSVLSVKSLAGSQALWEFSGPVSLATPAKLLINGTGATGTVTNPSPASTIVLYASQPNPADTWSITDATATLPLTQLPATGSVL